jgi:hypothetical protein
MVLEYVVPEVFYPAHSTTGPTSSGIIEEIKGLCDMGLALMAYFYCDFRDPQKQDASGLLSLPHYSARRQIRCLL